MLAPVVGQILIMFVGLLFRLFNTQITIFTHSLYSQFLGLAKAHLLLKHWDELWNCGLRWYHDYSSAMPKLKVTFVKYWGWPRSCVGSDIVPDYLKSPEHKTSSSNPGTSTIPKFKRTAKADLYSSSISSTSSSGIVACSIERSN